MEAIELFLIDRQRKTERLARWSLGSVVMAAGIGLAYDVGIAFILCRMRCL